MALSQSTRESMIANIPYYEDAKNRNTIVRPDRHLPGTLIEVEEALKNKDLPEADRKLIEQWFIAFSGVKIDSDTEAESKREAIAKQISSLRGSIEVKSATIKALTYPFNLDGTLVPNISLSANTVVKLSGETRDITINGTTVNVSKVSIGDKIYWIGTRDLDITGVSQRIEEPSSKSSPDINTLKNLNLSEISKSPASLRGEFEKVNKLSGPLQVAGWSVFFTKLRAEGYDIIFGKDPKNITVRTNNDAKGNQSEKDQRQKDIENQLRTLTESDPAIRKNILMGLLLQEGVFKNYLETNKITDGSTKMQSISVAEFQKYLQGGRTHSLAYTSLAAYDDALLREAAGIIPTQSEVDTTLRTLLTELQKKGVIDVNSPAAVAAATPADLRDSFAGNLSLPSSPIILAGGGLLYGFMKKDGGFLQGLKFGLIGVLVAIFGGMGSDWLKKNLGYDLGFTLGEQKVGLMKLEKKVNDLRNASEKNSRLTSSEMAAVKALVGEFDIKWKNEASVSPVGPAVSGMMEGNFDISKRLSDSPELNVYEEKINLYYLRAGGAIDSAELQRRLKEVDAKLAAAKASSTSGARTAGTGAAGVAGVNAPAASAANAPTLTPSQQKGVQSLNSQKSIIDTAIAMRQKTDTRINGTLQNYIDYVHSQDLLNLKLSSLIFNSDNKISIFSESKVNDFSNRPANLDPAILKRVMRAYFGIPDPTGTPNTPDWGKKEKEDFIKKCGIDEATWNDKTFSELVTKVYT